LPASLAGGAGAGRTVPIRWGNRPAFLWIAGRFGVLRFRLMVKPGPRMRPQTSEGQAQHGLDVSVKETSVCIVDDTGGIVREAKLASEPEALTISANSGLMPCSKQTPT
jgi:hypothetical protein